MAEDQKKRLPEELSKERPRYKRTRESSSQTDEEDAHEVREHACQRCCDANVGLSSIEKKLSTLLQILPEFETYKRKVNDLEQENKSMQKSIEDLQAEAKDLNSKLAATTSKLAEVTSQQEATHCALQRTQQSLAELQRRHIKLECHSRRGN